MVGPGERNCLRTVLSCKSRSRAAVINMEISGDVRVVLQWNKIICICYVRLLIFVLGIWNS